MSDTARSFCDAVGRRLATLGNLVRSMTLMAGPTLQVKLDEIRSSGKARQQAIQQSREKLQQWIQEKESEKQSTITSWRQARETKKLGDRAQRAEDHAAFAIQIVEASIHEAERMILETISARQDESIGRDASPDLQNWYVYSDSRHR